MALALEDVWPLWYEIGAGLEIPTSTLDQIQGAPEDQTIVRIFSVYVYTSSSVHIGARLGKLTVTKVSNNFWWFCMLISPEVL